MSASNPRHEDLSTEEVISQLEEAEKLIKEEGLCDVMVGSQDVMALYPSLYQEKVAEGVARFVRESKTKILGVDFREAQVFFAANMDPHVQKKEGVLNLLPKRTKKHGPRPGSTTWELWHKAPDPKDPEAKPKPSKWVQTDPEKDLTETDKR